MKFLKFCSIAVILLINISAITGVIHAIDEGNYFAYSMSMGVLMIIGTSLLAYGSFYLCKWIYSINPKDIALSYFLPIILLSFQACDRAKSNQQVLISENCGSTWKKVEAGNSVPLGTGNYCFMKVILPNFPMQGDARFISNLKDKVRAHIHIDYDYSIIEPLKFISQAKYLGKVNKSSDSEEALDPKEFEGAENMVIDKRLRDVSKEMFLKEDIVEFDQAELEAELQEKANKVLEPFGVRLNFIAITLDLDEQTRQAIDIATAYRIYQSKHLDSLGASIMKAKAGAPKITVETNTGNAKVSQEEK